MNITATKLDLSALLGEFVSIVNIKPVPTLRLDWKLEGTLFFEDNRYFVRADDSRLTMEFTAEDVFEAIERDYRGVACIGVVYNQ